MLKRQDLQNEWEDIVAKGTLQYNLLNRNERVWFNIEPLANSGLIDHYTNYGAEKNLELIEDLNYLGLNEISDLFQEVNNFFKERKPPKNIEDRNNEKYDWSDEKKGILEQNEKIFWSKVNFLEKKLLSHINKNIITNNR